MEYAIVSDGAVINVAVSDRALAADWVAVPTGCPVTLGDRYEDGLFWSPEGEVRLTPEARLLFDALEALEGGVSDA